MDNANCWEAPKLPKVADCGSAGLRGMEGRKDGDSSWSSRLVALIRNCCSLDRPVDPVEIGAGDSVRIWLGAFGAVGALGTNSLLPIAKLDMEYESVGSEEGVGLRGSGSGMASVVEVVTEEGGRTRLSSEEKLYPGRS